MLKLIRGIEMVIHTHPRRTLAMVLFAMLLMLAACNTQPASPTARPATGGEDIMSFTLKSPAFDEGSTIPTRFTCEGENVSPELRWQDAPADAQSFALIVDDPDAPSGTFAHWVLFDIPADRTSLPAAQQAGDVGTSGANGFGDTGYGGPCPPPGRGAHRYFFKLYALDMEGLGLRAGASRSQVEGALEGHVIAQAELMGRFER